MCDSKFEWNLFCMEIGTAHVVYPRTLRLRLNNEYNSSVESTVSARRARYLLSVWSGCVTERSDRLVFLCRKGIRYFSFAGRRNCSNWSLVGKFVSRCEIRDLSKSLNRLVQWLWVYRIGLLGTENIWENFTSSVTNSQKNLNWKEASLRRIMNFCLWIKAKNLKALLLNDERFFFRISAFDRMQNFSYQTFGLPKIPKETKYTRNTINRENLQTKNVLYSKISKGKKKNRWSLQFDWKFSNLKRFSIYRCVVYRVYGVSFCIFISRTDSIVSWKCAYLIGMKSSIFSRDKKESKLMRLSQNKTWSCFSCFVFVHKQIFVAFHLPFVVFLSFHFHLFFFLYFIMSFSCITIESGVYIWVAR